MADGNFTVEQVLEEVCVSDGNEDAEVACSSVKDAVKLSVNSFHPLRGFLNEYYNFRAEVTRCLEDSFKRYELQTSKMDRVLLSKASMWPMITREVLMWIKTIHRRMVASPRARNPWFIEIKRDLPQEIFCVIKDAVLSGISAFGVSVEDSVVKFNHKNRLYRDLSKFCCLTKCEIQNRLKKNFGARHKDFKAEVLVDNNKPFLVTYDKRGMRVIVSCHYGCWNNFGYGFHC